MWGNQEILEGCNILIVRPGKKTCTFLDVNSKQINLKPMCQERLWIDIHWPSVITLQLCRKMLKMIKY